MNMYETKRSFIFACIAVLFGYLISIDATALGMKTFIGMFLVVGAIASFIIYFFTNPAKWLYNVLIMEREAKIFDMNGCDWWTDYSMEEAKDHYSKFSGTTLEDDEWDEGWPIELKEEDVNYPPS